MALGSRPVASGAVASSNLEITQSSIGEFDLLAATQLNFVFAQESTPLLNIGVTSDVVYETPGFNTVEVISTIPLLVTSTSAFATILTGTENTGELVIAGSTETDTVFAQIVAVDSDGNLVLAGSSEFATVLEFTSSGELELYGESNFGEGKSYIVPSTGHLEIASTADLEFTTVFNSTADLELTAETGFESTIVLDLQVTSTGALVLASTTGLVVQRPNIVSVTSRPALLINSTTELDLLIHINLEVDSSGELRLRATNKYSFPLQEPPNHSGYRSTKRIEDEGRQVAFLSHVRTGRPQVQTEIAFYPAPPVFVVPEKKPRVQGAFGKFLDQYGNRLTYRFDSDTATVKFGVSSTVEVDTAGFRDQQIKAEDSLLLGLDDEELLLNSAKIWGIVDAHLQENTDHARRLQEDRDLLGIDE